MLLEQINIIKALVNNYFANVNEIALRLKRDGATKIADYQTLESFATKYGLQLFIGANEGIGREIVTLQDTGAVTLTYTLIDDNKFELIYCFLNGLRYSPDYFLNKKNKFDIF